MIAQKRFSLFCFLLTFISMITTGGFAKANPQVDKQPKKQPNIVFILIDDLRYDTFGYMDHPFIKTPHLDRLSKDGVRFNNAFVTTSLCSPARASFLTGQYVHQHRVVDNVDRMPEGTTTFPMLLQKVGYETAFMGKWHMGGSSAAPRPGFDRWVSFRGQGKYFPEKATLNIDGKTVPRKKYMTDELTDHAVQWLSTRKTDKPFFLYLSHKGVHGLYDPAPRHLNKYQGQKFIPPKTMANTAKNYLGKPMWVKNQRNSWHGVDFPYHGRAKQSVAEMYLHYCEMILSIDDSVGRVRDILKQSGFDKNTLVIFTSDGGHLWGEHGLIDKRCAYEESIRIPFLAYHPEMTKPNSQCQSLIANIDVAPTLLELAGTEKTALMKGESFAKLLSDPKKKIAGRDALLYEYYWEPDFPMTPTTFALRTENYKLIQYHGIWDTDELYDLKKDPQETTNLINHADQKQRVIKMRRQLYQKMKKTKGLDIPLGFKRNSGFYLRHPNRSQQATFPKHFFPEPLPAKPDAEKPAVKKSEPESK